MIPPELQKQIEEFTVKHKKYAEEQTALLRKKIVEFNRVLTKLDRDFTEQPINPIYREEWLTVREWIRDADRMILDINVHLGTQCQKCHGWIEERLKRGA